MPISIRRIDGPMDAVILGIGRCRRARRSSLAGRIDLTRDLPASVSVAFVENVARHPKAIGSAMPNRFMAPRRSRTLSSFWHATIMSCAPVAACSGAACRCGKDIHAEPLRCSSMRCATRTPNRADRRRRSRLHRRDREGVQPLGVWQSFRARSARTVRQVLPRKDGYNSGAGKIHCRPA